MDRQQGLALLHKSRLEILNCIKFFKAVKELENYDLMLKQFEAQREATIFKLRKEDDEKKLYRLQGRLDQIEELFSLEDQFERQLVSIEKQINDLSKGMKTDAS